MLLTQFMYLIFKKDVQLIFWGGYLIAVTFFFYNINI